MSRRAVVLAGGMGTRLRPYTVVLPKPLMPLCEYPILEVVVRQLAATGFERITMAVNHQAELIQAFFGKGERWNVRIDYSREDEPLGTMGPLRLIPDLPEHFLVMNGDVLTDLAYADFLDGHAAGDAVFTIASHVRRERCEYGILEVGEDHLLRGFHEKPWSEFKVSMGIYAVCRRCLDFIPSKGPFGFDDLMHALLDRRERTRVVTHDGCWLDIGRPDDYERAIDLYARNPGRFLPEKRDS